MKRKTTATNAPKNPYAIIAIPANAKLSNSELEKMKLCHLTVLLPSSTPTPLSGTLRLTITESRSLPTSSSISPSLTSDASKFLIEYSNLISNPNGSKILRLLFKIAQLSTFLKSLPRKVFFTKSSKTSCLGATTTNRRNV